MITNTGKEIIGKYLLGQAPAYASFIAIGCGAKPLSAAPSPGDYATKQNLDFEMFCVPISSRGFVNEGGTEKLVLTAELPTEERYEISEVGVYSAGSNPSAGAFDSKTVFTFAGGEGWQYHTFSAASPIPTITVPLDTNNDNIISTNDKVFQTNADNSIFYNTTRAERYERARFLNNVILIRGDDSDLIRKTATISNISTSSGIITYTTSANHNFVSGNIVSITGVNPSQYNLSNVTILDTLTSNSFRVTNPATGAYVSGGSATADHLSIEAGSNHIHLSGLDVNFTRNSALDELRLAFSLITKDASSAVPDTIRILITFAEMDAENSGEFASFEVDIDNSGDYNFSTNRYIVITKKLEELYQSSGFTWNAVTVAKIYACVIDSDLPSDNYYIALDALRLENTQTTNPLYGLTGYSVVIDSDEETIIKSPNTSNYIEFRFSVGVT